MYIQFSADIKTKHLAVMVCFYSLAVQQLSNKKYKTTTKYFMFSLTPHTYNPFL